MLFPYTYVPHKMEKMQEFINFIFHDVWCKAPTSGPFHLDLFLQDSALYEVMSVFAISDSEGADFFYSHVERIYAIFANLAAHEIDQLKLWYDGNNRIENACANDHETQIVRYAELLALHPDLCKQLATFFKGLYSHSLLGLSALRAHIGDIDDHYQAFVRINKKGKCPFCGMSDLLSEYHSKREAYDHYLPKAHYPFNSINFHNLVPVCHHCNSSYKTSKDPAYEPKHPTHNVQRGQRRKVFYPFTTQPHAIEIRVELQSTDVQHLEPEDVDFQFGPAHLSEEIQTWLDVYGIDERYKAKYCGENDGKYWFLQAMEEWPGGPVAMLANLRQTTRPYGDCNFLKMPLLEACERIGLFTPVTLQTPHAAP